MARQQASDAPAPDALPDDGQGPAESTPRTRRVVRIFLITAGGLAAPCLALAAFFLSNGGGSDAPAPSAGAVPGGRSTTTTAAGAPTTPTTAGAPTTTTTTPAAVPVTPPRNPFAPLVAPAPAGGAPAR